MHSWMLQRQSNATHPPGEIARPELVKNNSSAFVAAGSHECLAGRMGRWVIVVDIGLEGAEWKQGGGGGGGEGSAGGFRAPCEKF